MVKVGVLGYFSPRAVAHSWVRRSGGQWSMFRVVDIFVPAQQRVLGQVRRLGGQVRQLEQSRVDVFQSGPNEEQPASDTQLQCLNTIVLVRLGCQSRLGARECTTYCTFSSRLRQWHIALSHNIAIYGRCHVTYVRRGESQDRQDEVGANFEEELGN